jgi:hypothetical protein
MVRLDELGGMVSANNTRQWHNFVDQTMTLSLAMKHE